MKNFKIKYKKEVIKRLLFVSSNLSLYPKYFILLAKVQKFFIQKKPVNESDYLRVSIPLKFKLSDEN